MFFNRNKRIYITRSTTMSILRPVDKSHRTSADDRHYKTAKFSLSSKYLKLTKKYQEKNGNFLNLIEKNEIRK